MYSLHAYLGDCHAIIVSIKSGFTLLALEMLSEAMKYLSQPTNAHTIRHRPLHSHDALEIHTISELYARSNAPTRSLHDITTIPQPDPEKYHPRNTVKFHYEKLTPSKTLQVINPKSCHGYFSDEQF